MRIENKSLTPNFGRAYIDMQSLNKYGQSLYFANGRSKIITALKDRNTPLRKFIREVINTPKFEKEYGDVFISFNRQNILVKGKIYLIWLILSFQNCKRKLENLWLNS